MKDPYEILGLARTASAEEVRKTYRRLAKTLHPDLNPGDKDAEARFKEASAAYDLLSDAEKRRRYDAGEIDASGAERPQQRYYKDFAGGEGDERYYNASGFGDFAGADDAFAELFGRRAARARRGGDLYLRLNIDFLDAVNGATRRVTLPDGRWLDIAIPAGIEDGQTLRLPGKGQGAPSEGQAGDALVELGVKPHRFFERRGDDIHVELPITLSEAVLGAKVRTPTPGGAVMLNVPKGSNTGVVLRLKGKGVRRGDGGHGDELVKLKIVLPQASDAELEDFVSKWTKAGYDPRKDMQ